MGESYICPACDGSGEGQYESTTCRSCKGHGEIPEGTYEDEDDCDAADHRFEQERERRIFGED